MTAHLVRHVLRLYSSLLFSVRLSLVGSTIQSWPCTLICLASSRVACLCMVQRGHLSIWKWCKLVVTKKLLHV
ncbi:hypothetical protein DFP73DRAFT_555673 [Morchella snyderi]|nr:hypothetical protein DFP73DRAFT_555673 [Morchella snyderi]